MDQTLSDKKKLFSSLFIAVIMVVVLWLIKLIEYVFGISFVQLGLYPLKATGLIGILFAPMIHGDFSHLAANSLSLFMLTWMLFYFYRQISWKVFLLTWVFSGLWVWFFARPSYHIGASGLVYGLAAFLFVSGLIRRNPPLMIATLIVAFLYGSMVWGVFPEFFPEKNISWESHFMGFLAGLILAVFYRKEGPKRKIYSWEWDELEEDDEDDDDPNAYWNKTIS
jgi:membrane associated rhomboid family serine protease